MVRARRDSATLVKLLSIDTEVPENVYYTVAAPSHFRSFAPFDVAVTLHDPNHALTGPCPMRVHIEDAEDERNYVNEHGGDVHPNTTEIISINVEELSMDRDYKLVVTALSGVKFRHESPLNLLSKTHAILIQTDKPKYKPSELVRFRVLVLDKQLKAATLPWDKLSIYIEDPNGNRMKQWDKVETKKGVFEADFELSDQPNLGSWYFNATVGEESKRKSFSVDEYVPPKFEVLIDCDEKQSLKADNLNVSIHAKYYYGKELHGHATVGVYKYEDLIVEKKINVPGDVSFKMRDEIKDEYEYFIRAKVFENATSDEQSALKHVNVQQNYYNGSIESDVDQYVPDEPFTIKVHVTKFDGTPIKVGENNKTFKIIREDTVFEKNNGVCEENKEIIVESFELDSSADFKMTIKPNKDQRYIYLRVYYEDEEICTRNFYKKAPKINKKKIEAKVLTEDLESANEITVNVTSDELIDSYSYMVVARRRILFAKSVYFTDDQKTNSCDFSFPAKDEFNCGAQIVVFAIRNGDLASDYVSYDIKRELSGNLNVSLSNEVAKPGESINIDISANDNAFVGLLGVDKCVIAENNDNDLSSKDVICEQNEFYNNVSRYNYASNYYNDWNNFRNCALILFTNIERKCHPELFYRCMVRKSRMTMACQAEMVMDSEMMPGLARGINNVIIRKDFPETWIWDSIYEDGIKGKRVLTKKVPDSLTTWVLTAFSIDPEIGLSIIKEPKTLKVFQPFFVSIQLPYSIKRGEIVSIPFSIFNYQEKEIVALLVVQNEFNDYQFTDPSVQDQKSVQIELKVPANDCTTSWVYIKPTRVGTVPIKAITVSDGVSDGIVKTLIVEPEGVPQYINKSIFVDLREKQTLETLDVEIEIPKEAIPDSTRVEVHCVGDLLGGTIKNLSRLIRLPMGCGEQNMMSFVPNIVILNYLKNTNQLTPEIERKTKKYTEIGYQTQLTYKHYDGAFSCFGIRDKKGCTWLTAFVVKSFRQAAEHIAIDERIIEESLEWLAQKQDMDGNFNEEGSIWDREMQGGSAKGVALTAYVLTAFLENKHKHDRFNCVIDKAIKYIEKCHSEVTDLYALGLLSYALQHTECSIKTEVLDRFFKLSRNANELLWWEKAAEKEKSEKLYYRLPTTFNIELTGYGLLALMKSDKPNQDQCLSILKWLLSQRNSRGGFEGTQDTVVGLEALAKYAEKISSNDRDISIEFETEDTKGRFEVSPENPLVRQSQVLPLTTKKMNVKATGKGFALFEVSYKYHVNSPASSAAFKLKSAVKVFSENNFGVDIAVSFNDESKENAKSNMAVMEVTMPSGYIVEREALNDLPEKIEAIKRTETRNGETIAVIYFENIGKEELKICIRGMQTIEVKELKPASITVYDYYDSSLRTQTAYSLA